MTFACLSHLKYSSKGTSETRSYTFLSSCRLTREDRYCKICWGIRNVEVQANVSAVKQIQSKIKKRIKSYFIIFVLNLYKQFCLFDLFHHTVSAFTFNHMFSLNPLRSRFRNPLFKDLFH